MTTKYMMVRRILFILQLGLMVCQLNFDDMSDIKK